MTKFNLRFSAFSICWLRAYDFGLEQDVLRQALANLEKCPLVKDSRNIANSKEIDEADSLMFDIRYQERSKLVRVSLHSFDLVDQDLSTGRLLSAPITVNLMLDLASGFGVMNLSLPRVVASDTAAYTVEEIEFLTSQWLLNERLQIRLPLSEKVEAIYLREAMNYYFLNLHKILWEAANPERYNPLSKNDNFYAWLNTSQEVDPFGCNCLRTLYKLGLTRCLFPTSFGPIIDLWGIDGFEINDFDANTFSTKFSREIAWIFTDGQRDSLGEDLHNERQTKSLALFVWPNHALYINQNRNSLLDERIQRRLQNYGCLDVEVIRIFEIINLQSALLHVFDSQLDQQLEEVSSLTAQDQHAVIRITEQRRNITRLMGSFDFFNLFHTAYWEPLYSRLLDNPRLRLIKADNLVEMKSKRLDEEIQKAVIIQDRTRQQQEREQELDVLRGLHSLSLANDIQSNALLIINFVVSATASFAFTEVLSPWLTRLSGSLPSFPEAYPLLWIILNIGIFVLVAFTLTFVTKFLIRAKSQVTELEGRLNSPYNADYLEAYLRSLKGLEYFHLDANDHSGYIRIRKRYGVLLLEFDRRRFHRYVFFGQEGRLINPESLNLIDVDNDIKEFTGEVLAENAKHVLVNNDLGLSTKPSPKLYPHQWNWDSAFIAIGLVHLDIERAKREIRSLLRGQWKNGMIPQIIYNPQSNGYFPNSARWQISRSKDAPDAIATSGITQPPMVTVAVWEIARQSSNMDFVEEVYSHLLEYHKWFHYMRDPKQEGLVSIIHPWESGMDNSPRWDKIMKQIILVPPEFFELIQPIIRKSRILRRIGAAARPTYQRYDNRHVSSKERPSKADYDRFVYLMDLARDLDYFQESILAHSPFVVQDVLVNSILFRADQCLKELAKMIGQPVVEIDCWLEMARKAFAEKLWNAEDSTYYDYDVQGSQPIQENTIASFLPLYAGLAGEVQARLLVEKHLMNPAEYAPDARHTRFRLPTVSKGSHHFSGHRYWRGPIWVNINWLVMQGLDRYGYADLARRIRVDTFDLLMRGGFSEYFNPRTGEGYGTTEFSWSAALLIDLLTNPNGYREI